MILERSNTFTTIREKFHHLVLLGGAQFAANLTVDHTEGQLFVKVVNQWLWSSPSGLGSRTFTDQELERMLSLLEVCQTLLDSAEDTLMIDCGGDEYSVRGDYTFDRVPLFDYDLSGIEFSVFYEDRSRNLWGTPSGFLYKFS